MTQQKAKPSNQSAVTAFDCIIAGAGYAGLTFAYSLAVSLPELKICIVDPRNFSEPRKDKRASAIASSGRKLFQALDVWELFLEEAQPINDMVVTDSRLSDTIRPTLLKFERKNVTSDPFAHMIPNQLMETVLAQKCRESGVTILDEDLVENFETHSASQEIILRSGLRLSAKLLVAADGVRSKLRQLAHIKTVGWRYKQSAIVATINHSEPHEGRAFEHFLPAGPLAVLPLRGNSSSLVWTESPEKAQKLLTSDVFSFLFELERRIGGVLGKLELASERQCFPLGLMLAKDFVRPRLALLGDAAHGIHPIAGQGLNLGLRDVAALSQTLVEAARLGQDIGSLAILEDYQKWRRFDTVQMGITTDMLNRLFSNDIAPLRAIRDLGLGIVERMPSLKNYFIGEASGQIMAQPKLLMGELP